MGWIPFDFLDGAISVPAAVVVPCERVSCASDAATQLFNNREKKMKKQQGKLSSDVLQIKEMLTYYWALGTGNTPSAQGTRAKVREAQTILTRRTQRLPLLH